MWPKVNTPWIVLLSYDQECSIFVTFDMHSMKFCPVFDWPLDIYHHMKKMLIYAITSPLLLIYWVYSIISFKMQQVTLILLRKKTGMCWCYLGILHWMYFWLFSYFYFFFTLSIFFLLDCLLSLVLLLVLKNSMI